MELFLHQGFDETTVEEIAESAGISRRSYFRYFSSKDEALAEGLASIGSLIAEALEARPKTEDAWHALRRAFDPIVEQADTDPRAEALGRLMLQHPGLQRDKDALWASTITKSLRSRLSSGHRNTVQVDALVASAIACLHVAQEHWLSSGARIPLGTLLDESMKAIRSFESDFSPLLDTTMDTTPPLT